MPPQTFGWLCVDSIKTAALVAHGQGHKLTYSEIASLIDLLYDGVPKPESTTTPKSSNPSPFGDRKAIPPQPELVTLYSASIGWPLDGEAFCDFYERKGWMVGRTKMKDWQAACRYAKRERFGFGGPSKNGTTDEPTNYSKF